MNLWSERHVLNMWFDPRMGDGNTLIARWVFLRALAAMEPDDLPPHG